MIYGTAGTLDKKGNYMHFQFLIEDQSGEIILTHLMKKICIVYPSVTVNYKAFKGIGGFKKKNTVKEIKTGKLLNDLTLYLKGFNRSLRSIKSAIIVVLDNDTRETRDFRNELESIASQNNISIDHVFCIAVKEIEAWLLGDREAVLTAYPDARVSILDKYVQDSICGTWEILADATYHGGYKKFMKDCGNTYSEIGKHKCEWAEKIGQYMIWERNCSPSFKLFMTEIYNRLPSK